MRNYDSPCLSVKIFKTETIKTNDDDIVSASYDAWSEKQESLTFIKKNLGEVQQLISYKF